MRWNREVRIDEQKLGHHVETADAVAEIGGGDNSLKRRWRFSWDEWQPQPDPIRRLSGTPKLAPHEAVLHSLVVKGLVGVQRPIRLQALLRPNGQVSWLLRDGQPFRADGERNRGREHGAVVIDASFGDADLAAFSGQPGGDMQRRDRNRSQQIDRHPAGCKGASSGSTALVRRAAIGPPCSALGSQGPCASSVGSQVSRPAGTNSELTAVP